MLGVVDDPGGRRMQFREPRAGWVGFLWLWALVFGGVPLLMLAVGGATGAPVVFLLLFPAIAVAVLVPTTRRSMRAGFSLEEDGIHGAHDAESDVLPWDQVERILWRFSRETSGVKVNGRPLPDGYALHARLHDGREVRLMQRVASTYGQQQDCNEQLAAAAAAGALPVPFDATIPTHDGGAWSGTPPPRSHMRWGADELPPATDSPLDDGDDGPVWPTGG